jgi:hypothetical protein
MNQPQRSRGGAHSWIRGNVLGLVAIFIALSGSAVATQVASKQVTSKQVATAAGKKRGPRGPAGPPGAPGPQGIPGAAGLLSGPASGDLTGNYPNPQIASEAVGPPETGVVPAAKASSTLGTSIPSATDTAIPLPNESFDYANMHDDVIENESVNAPIDGLYLVEATLAWEPSDSGGVLRTLTLAGSGPPVSDARAALQGVNTINSVSAVVEMDPGNEVHLVANQNSGAALNAFGRLTLVWLGPRAPA